jgi:hypothetical protein
MNTENKDIEYSILNIDNVEYKTLLTKKYLQRKPFKDLEKGVITAFISGLISDVFVKK